MALEKENVIINTDVAAATHNHSAKEITSGILPLERGGTGQNSIATLKSSLGLYNCCKIQHGSVINHSKNLVMLYFDFVPKIVFITAKYADHKYFQPLVLINGSTSAWIIDRGDYNQVTLDWNNKWLTIEGSYTTNLIDLCWVALG